MKYRFLRSSKKYYFNQYIGGGLKNENTNKNKDLLLVKNQ